MRSADDRMTRSVRRHAAGFRDEAQEGPRRHLAIERRALRQISHALLRAAAVLRDIDAEHLCEPVFRLQVAGDHAHGGGLAGAVGAEKTHHFTDIDGKADVVDGDPATKTFPQAFDLQQHVRPFGISQAAGVYRQSTGLSSTRRRPAQALHPQRQAAIDRQPLSGDKTAVLRRQEQRRARQIDRLAEATQR
ncbi:MAG: hypothetical protein FD124_2626 [Alphaproteobacteria bacterium]|nr:MAG: hypothetical protein FD124_2626 [Alphaproteobacteria bacterium]